MKTCTKCNIEKSLDDFNNHPDGPMGKDTQCKKCKAEYAREYRKKNPEKVKANNIKFRDLYMEETGGYAVYCLPVENYVGFTNSIRRRMSDHRKKGKDMSGFHIIKTFDCPIQAHLFETMFHLAGYGGFQHKY
jgi:hypothetical protein